MIKRGKKRKSKKQLDISNKMLVAFVLLAIAVSLVSLFTIETETKLTFYDSGIRMLTGLSGTNETVGNITTTIESYTYINFTNRSIGWGSGYVDASATFCNLIVDWDGSASTEGDGTQSCSDGWFNSANSGITSPLVIENLGNEDVALNISMSHKGSSLFGGTSPAISFRVFQGEGYGTCLNNSGGLDNIFSFTMDGGETYTNYSNWLVVFNNDENFPVCSWFNSSSANNQINIGVNFSIPSTSSVGAKSLIITAYGRTCDAVDGTTNTHLNCTANHNTTMY